MRRFLALLLVIVFTLFTSCSNVPLESETPENTSKNNDVDLLRQVPDEAYIESVSLYYKDVRSVTVNGNFLYASVFDAEDASHPEKLIVYNLSNASQVTLFEVELVTGETDTIEYIQADNNWVVWATVQRMGGNFVSVYIMNISTKEITQVKEMDWNSPYVSGPVYTDGKIFWKDTVEGVATVCQYDCNTKTKTVIAENADVSGENLELCANDGKVVWFDHVDSNGMFFVYDIETKKTDTILLEDELDVDDVQASDIALHNDGIIATVGVKTISIDIKTKNVYTLGKACGDVFATEKFMATQLGSITNFFSYDASGSTTNLNLERYYVDLISACDNDTIVTVAENEGYHQESSDDALEYSMIHIYRFNEMK